MPRTLGEIAIRDVPVLRSKDFVGNAIRDIVDAGLPALPVVDSGERLCGIFGEREFISAIFPGYLGELKYAGFLNEELEQRLEKRQTCMTEPVSKYMNTEHVDVGTDYADAQLAEIFLHHRVLIVPVVDDGAVRGIITRSAFFKELVARFAQREG